MKGIYDVINSTGCVYINETTTTTQYFFWTINKIAFFGRSLALYQLITIIFINLFQIVYVTKRMQYRRSYRFAIFNAFSDVFMSCVMLISLCLQSCFVLQLYCRKKEVMNECEIKSNLSSGINHTLSFLSNTAVMSSTWAIVIISCDRLRAIKYPLRGKRTGLLGNTRTIIAIIILFIALTNISRYWESNTIIGSKENVKNDRDGSSKNFDRLRLTFMLIRILIHILVPSLILIITNALLVRHLQTRSQTFERVKWNTASKSFELESPPHSTKNKFCSLFTPCKNSSRENKITTNIIIMITIHIVTFTPTTLYNLYFEIIFPILKIYFDKQLPSFNVTVVFNNQHGFNVRREVAYIPIFIFFIGKIVNALLMSNISNFIMDNYHKLFFWKYLCKRATIDVGKKDSNGNQRKETRVYYSNLKKYSCNESVNIELYPFKSVMGGKNTN
uniref:G_PROTEIN_RECEP_F1_2 domain-containing protein n=1 Tax=Strongyloides venezuelensis TaxID=75913 RepID=A0A0K0F0V9_STRVS